MLAKARFSRWLNFRVFQHNPQKAVIPERLGERAKSTEAVRKPDARLCIVARRTDFHVFSCCAQTAGRRAANASTRGISTLSDFPHGDSTQEPPQEIGTSDDALLLSPHQDQVLVDDIIFSMLRLHLH